MKRFFQSALLLFVCAGAVEAQRPPLLPEETVAALEQELSGETAKRNLEYVSRQHRTRGSRPFRIAADFIVAQAKAYGLADAQVLEFPADGKIFYGTQRSRPGWDAEFAELWEVQEREGRWVRTARYASWEAAPITLAQDSESGEVTADLVDVGAGTGDADYAGKDVRGKIVLTSQQPGAIAELAVGKYGAAGIVSYAQNQRTAWWGEDENLIRWGHLETFAPVKTWAFMVSLKQARSFRERLARGERIRLEAKVVAGAKPGVYSIGTATIPGSDAKLREQEIVFSCHLDHPRPGANDNASGCVTILEVARTLAKLIREGRIAAPKRTIRFVWPPEIEGTVVLLNARPEIASRIKAAVHMDMVGGGPETKAVFHVTRGPMSLPSFVFDVADAFAEFVNQQSYQYAATGQAKYPFVSAEGGKEPLRAMLSPFSSGSDHQVYMDSSWRIPSVYLNDWPDRYIHTDKDSVAMIDPTKLKRAGFIGAATGYYLAQLGGEVQRSPWAHLGEAIDLLKEIWAGQLRRMTRMLGQSLAVKGERGAGAYLKYETEVMLSVNEFAEGWTNPNEAMRSVLLHERIEEIWKEEPEKSGPVFERNAEPKGPMSVFGYDYFEDQLGREAARRVRLLGHRGLWGASGDMYAYEVLNFVDGKRTAQEIRDAVSAEFGPVPLELVVEYLRALEKIGVVRAIK
jgi:aminopeptidase YwaD